MSNASLHSTKKYIVRESGGLKNPGKWKKGNILGVNILDRLSLCRAYILMLYFVFFFFFFSAQSHHDNIFEEFGGKLVKRKNI